MGNLGDLKAQQLILLAVFVSFVTSVATGITTVSLIEAAPAPVQQVVNRVVERTVERVVPEEKEDEDQKPPEKEVVTVVVKEEDLVTGAVDQVSKSVARVYVKGTDEFASLGVAVGPRRVLVDAEMVALEGEYDVSVGGAARVLARVLREQGGFALLEIAPASPDLAAPQFATPDALKLAQSLIAVAGRTSPAVATGALVSVSRDDAGAVTSVQASLSGAEILPGTPVANIRGEVIGLRLAAAGEVGTFVPVSGAPVLAATE